jgi:hypothetical protein
MYQLLATPKMGIQSLRHEPARDWIFKNTSLHTPEKSSPLWHFLVTMASHHNHFFSGGAG